MHFAEYKIHCDTFNLISVREKSSFLSFVINGFSVVIVIRTCGRLASIHYFMKSSTRSPLKNPFTTPIRFYIAHETQGVWPKVVKRTHSSTQKGKVISFFARRLFFSFSVWKFCILFESIDIQITLTVSCELSERYENWMEISENSSEHLSLIKKNATSVFLPCQYIQLLKKKKKTTWAKKSHNKYFLVFLPHT